MHASWWTPSAGTCLSRVLSSHLVMKICSINGYFTLFWLNSGGIGKLRLCSTTSEHIGISHFVHYREVVLSSLCTVEPLNKGHVGTCHFVHYREVALFLMYSGIKDTLGPAILSTIERLSSSLCTVEPLNKGHIGTCHFVHYREVVLFLMYSGTSE